MRGRMDSKSGYGAPRIVVRRYCVLMGALAAVGLAAGIVLSILHSSQASATALVLSPTAVGAGSSPAAEKTQVLIATSTPVFTAAARSLSLAVTPADLTKHVKVKFVGSNVMSVRVTAPRVSGAIAEANAVTVAYLGSVQETPSSRGAAVLVPTVGTSPTFPFVKTTIDGTVGLTVGLAIGVLAWWKQRRDWHEVQLI